MTRRSTHAAIAVLLMLSGALLVGCSAHDLELAANANASQPAAVVLR